MDDLPTGWQGPPRRARGCRRPSARGAAAGATMAPMLGPIGHLAALAAYGFRRGAQVRHDLDAHRELAWAQAGVAELPRGLEIQWLGTAGFRLSYQGQHLLIDPYLTRLPLGDLAAPPGGARRRRAPGRAARSDRDPGRPHPLRSRPRRAGAGGPRRLSGLRLALAGPPDGAPRSGRARGRGRAAPPLRARPVHGDLHPEQARQAGRRPVGALRRRADLRARRRLDPAGLQVRPGLGPAPRGRRRHDLPPGLVRSDRGRAGPSRRRRAPVRDLGAALHRPLRQPAACAPSRRSWSCRTTSTTSSVRSTRR
jgi:hypothetical protein